MKNFEETTPRGRTMSAPRLRSAGLERTTKKSRRGGVVVLEKPEPRGSLDTDRSSEPPQTPRSQSRYDTSPAIAVADEDEWVKLSVDDVPLVCRIYFIELFKNADSTFFCASLSSQPTAFAQSPYDPYYWGRVRNRKQRPSAIDNNHDSITSLNRSIYTPWSDGGLGGESRSFFSDDESQWFYDSSGFRYGGTDGEGHVSQPAHNPIGTRKPVARSSSPPPSLNRRPLYHYIRNKTPTAQSTFDCGVVPEITPKQHIPPQQYANRLVQQPTAAFPPSVDELGFLTPALPIISSSRKGFSLSGETEQKMDLERKVHDGRFIFHEGKPRKRDRIMRGLRRFKSFFNSQG